ncbi:MAG: lytic murein transglycosylase [Actinomycetota bacterium]|nr:lytic murein transglycosylase [Actinomycetota bacterium]
MQSQAQVKLKRRNLVRIGAALCITGLVATGLGTGLLGAGAEDVPVPGEHITQSLTTTTEALAQATASGSDQSDAPASSNEAGPEQTPATSKPTQHAGPPAPAANATAAPATPATAAPAAAAPKPTRSAPKLGEVAGPADEEKPAGDTCVKSNKKAKKGKLVKSSGKADEAKHGGLVNTPESAQSAKTGCQHTPAAKKKPKKTSSAAPDSPAPTPMRNSGGVPTTANPTTSLASPGPVAVGVPNFFINKFRIPPFLLPIYQAAGIQYGIRWEILAAINEIETDYGRNLNISSAGALGWMQFMPPTWKAYGVDANRDGRKDPFNPVDAIFAAARYLKAAGADKDLRRGIFAYNHADWYVDSVLVRARLIGGLPADLVGSLSGLTQGHFPVHAKARYADDISEREAKRRVKTGTNAAMPIESVGARRDINIYAEDKSPVIAVQDGKITAVGQSKRLGRYVRMRDVYGNTYTYGHLGTVASKVAVPKRKTQSKASIAKELELPKRDPKPTKAASAGKQLSKKATKKAEHVALTDPAAMEPETARVAKERLFAHPTRKRVLPNGGARQIAELEYALADGESLRNYMTGVSGLDREDVVLKPLAPGRKVIAGTILGRVGKTSEKTSPHLMFEIRPAGRGAPRIDPKPILDGWKLLESTAIYRAQGKNALLGRDAPSISIGQILLMSKETLIQRVLANPRIEIYTCGRRDIASGGIDRRILASLEFLASSGLKPTITSLTCGHGFFTSSGNVSAHSSGAAVDIAKVNGIPIMGHQGEGSITDITIRRLLTLQGTMKPTQIISLMKFGGTDNTLAMGDHDDHIHVGFRPQFDPNSRGARQLEAVLKPAQWIKLIDRLGRIDNPTVRVKPSKYSIRVPVRRASGSHRGE